jgi:hypothetical protein
MSDDLAGEYSRRLIEGLTSFGFDFLFRRMRVLNANTFRRGASTTVEKREG